MKSLRTLLSITVFGSLIALLGCGGGGGNSEPLSDKQFGLISKTWKIKGTTGAVLLGTADSTSHWTNFKLTVSGTKGQTATYAYSCTGRPTRSVWKSSGTWQFGTDPATSILRDDDAQITYSVDASGQNLQLQFTFTGTGYTRVDNVSGAWTFNLIPN